MSQMTASTWSQTQVHRHTCVPLQANSVRPACWHARSAQPTSSCRAAFGTVPPGRGQRTLRATDTSDTKTVIGPMYRPPGPGYLYPENEENFQEMLETADEVELQAHREAIAARYAEGNPFLEMPDGIFDVIESPPEWGRPDEGNPNQPRRPPEYQPPQEPVPGTGKPLPEFEPPERAPASPPMPEDDPMRPLPPEQPEIPPNERNPLRRAPDEIPDKKPDKKSDEQTQPQPGEASAFDDTTNGLSDEDDAFDEETDGLSDEEIEMLVWALLDNSPTPQVLVPC